MVKSTPKHCDNVFLALACSLDIPGEESDLCLAHCTSLVPAGSTGSSLVPEPPYRVPGKEDLYPCRIQKGDVPGKVEGVRSLYIIRFE